MSGATTWTSGEDVKLRALWAQQLSTRVIGQHLGVTKNAVIGRARRLGLLARPSPIVPTGIPRPSRVRGAPTLAQIVEVVVAPALAKITVQPAPIRPEPVAPAPKPIIARPIEVDPPKGGIPYASPDAVRCCQFVIDATRFAQRICGAAQTQGQQYCRSHVLLCCVPVRTTA